MSQDIKPILDLLSGDDLLNTLEWADQLGYLPEEVFGVEGIIPSRDKTTLNHWYRSKISVEGLPDETVVDEIGAEGVIRRPVVLDSDREYCIEGRHRLASALKYNLDCPVVDIILVKKPQS